MKESDMVTLIGIVITCILTFINLIRSIIRDKQTDYVTKVTDYRLKWIDLARVAIAEYLFSIDRLSRGDAGTLRDDYSSFLEKHWKMQSLLTTFSPVDKNAQEIIEAVYDKAELLADPKCENREKIRKELLNEIETVDLTLRKLMDDQWKDVKDEVK